jgi:hypothetical protein
MTISSRSSDIRTSVILNIRNYAPITALCILYLVSLLANSPRVSTALLVLMVIWCTVTIADSRSSFFSILYFVGGAIAFSMTLQFGGEVVGSWVVSPLPSGLLLVSCLLMSLNTLETNLRPNGSVAIRTAAISTPILVLIRWVSGLKESELIDILGYGYDNVGFVAQARMILAANGTSILRQVPDIGPTYVLDAPQASGTLIATLVRLTSGSQEDSSTLTVALLTVNCLLPILSTAAVWCGISRFCKSRVVRISLVTSTAIIILASYFGRIWFSGYLSSNLATLLLILLGMHLTPESRPSLRGTIVLIVLIGHTYAPFMAIALVLSMPSIVAAVLKTPKQNFFLSWSLVKASLGVFGIASTLLLPFIAIRRTFGAGQFLADGGIEPLPSSQLVVLLAAILLPVFALGVRMSAKFEILSPIILALALSGLVATYSLGAKGYVAYYPTKTIIALYLFILAFSAPPSCAFLNRVRFSSAIQTIFVAGIVFVGFGDQEQVFTTPYMGKLTWVVREFSDPSPIVVNGSDVEQWSNWAKTHQTPVLYLVSTHESELNTRWINVLAGTWTDQSWSDWLTVRERLNQGPSELVGRATAASSLVVVSDSEEVMAEARQLGYHTCSVSESPRCPVQDG